ncbi:MAG: hypothetical protein V2A73_21180 [Pseudomonadota bacterium]
MTKIHPTAMAMLLLCGLGACKDDPGSTVELGKPKAAEPYRAAASTRVTTPVLYGKKLSCSALLDPAKVGPAMGKEVVIDDRSASEEDATAVCQVKLAGTPPTAKQQERMWIEGGRVLGVLPGDELCSVTLLCSFVFDSKEQQEKCQADGQKVSTEIGDPTCVKAYEAGADYRYVVSVLDADTKCKIVVNPGPSVKDEATPKQCARIATELITAESIKADKADRAEKANSAGALPSSTGGSAGTSAGAPGAPGGSR